LLKEKNQHSVPCPLSPPLLTDMPHLPPLTTMTQNDKMPAPDFRELAPAIEELEVQLALAQLTLSLLKVQVMGAMEKTQTATKKTYTQAMTQMMTAPTAQPTSTSSGDSQNKPSNDGDKMPVGPQEWGNMGWTSSWSTPPQDQKPWPTSAGTWSTRSQHSSERSRPGKTNSYHKQDHRWEEPSWKMLEDSRNWNENEHILMHYSFYRRNRCWWHDHQ
jgi:hypothetical protein